MPALTLAVFYNSKLTEQIMRRKDQIKVQEP